MEPRIGLSNRESINMKTGKTPARKEVQEKELITAYPQLFVTDMNRAANYYEQIADGRNKSLDSARREPRPTKLRVLDSRSFVSIRGSSLASIGGSGKCRDVLASSGHAI
jgi:hypothetical protein